MIFSARDEAHGIEVWRSDGTEKGTWLVADVSPGPESSDPGGFTRDGTGEGTMILRDVAASRL